MASSKRARRPSTSKRNMQRRSQDITEQEQAAREEHAQDTVAAQVVVRDHDHAAPSPPENTQDDGRQHIRLQIEAATVTVQDSAGAATSTTQPAPRTRTLLDGQSNSTPDTAVTVMASVQADNVGQDQCGAVTDQPPRSLRLGATPIAPASAEVTRPPSLLPLPPASQQAQLSLPDGRTSRNDPMYVQRLPAIPSTAEENATSVGNANRTQLADVDKSGKRTMRRWTEEEVALLLEYWEQHVVEYKTKRKADFYRNVAGQIEHKDADQIRSKCSDIERRYKEMHSKLATTGFGVDEGEKRTLREWVEGKFPLYYQADNFLSGRSSIDPPVIFESGVSATTGAADASRVEAAEEVDASIKALIAERGSSFPASTLQSDLDADGRDSYAGDDSLPLTQASMFSLADIALTQPSVQQSQVPASSETDIQLAQSSPPTQVFATPGVHELGSTARNLSETTTPSTTTAIAVKSTQSTNSRTKNKRSAAETLADSLTLLGERHIIFQREKLSRTLEFEWKELEQTRELENKKLELKLEIHRAEMKASQQQHEEIMQLRQAKLEALLRTQASTGNETPEATKSS